MMKPWRGDVKTFRFPARNRALMQRIPSSTDGMTFMHPTRMRLLRPGEAGH
jgi:hypothetical protein